jgi:hypothetical protein
MKLKVSINRGLINKNEAGDTALFTTGWTNEELTPHQFAQLINKGFAYCAQLTGTRKSANFLCSDVLSVDFDNRRISEVLAEPLVRQFATIFYTTPSNTPEANRFRIVFALPRTIVSAPEMVAASRSLTLRLRGDPSTTDATRIFYGSKGSDPEVFERRLSLELLDELIEEGKRSYQPDTISSGGEPVTTVSRLTIAPQQQIKLEGGDMMPFSDLKVGTRVHCPFHYDENPSAFVLQSSDGSSKGLRCSTCVKTFWPATRPQPSYDFFSFEKTLREVHEYFNKYQQPNGVLRFAVNKNVLIREGLERSNIRFVDEQYLRLPKIEDGITLVKSPKGTGKTEAVSRALGDTSGSVLLIGHRVALISQSCARFGLENYLEFSKGSLQAKRLGICLDSLHRLSWRERISSYQSTTRYNDFHTIIIDESEQVLSHFLSQTLEENRRPIFLLLRRLLKRARRVIALDADLGWLTFETLTKLINDKPGEADPDSYFKPTQRADNVRPCFVLLNEHKATRKLMLFNSEGHLTSDLMDSIADGKRVFVTSNSKRRIDYLYEAIREHAPGVPLIKVTSDTNQTSEVKELVSNTKLALKYQAILTSPSLGTGVDIAFEDHAQEIDSVYGFCNPLITTHFDFDQQLARVRHPGEVKVWITPNRYQFDTGLEVIKHELQERQAYTGLLIDFDDHLRPVYHTEDSFTDMAALVVSQQRASKNDLRHHFVELKKHQGWTVEVAQAPVEEIAAAGLEILSTGADLSQSRYTKLLLGAQLLNKQQARTTSERIENRDQVSVIERANLERTMIELFYREKLTAELVDRDDRGTLRKCIRTFESLLSQADFFLKYGGHSKWAQVSPASDPELRFVRNSKQVAGLLYHLVTKTPLLNGKSFRTDIQISVADLNAFAREVARLKPIIENILNVAVRHDVGKKPVMFLNRLLNLIGLAVTSAGKKTLKKVNAGKPVYFYELDGPRLQEMLAFVAVRKNVRGWQSLYEREGWPGYEDTDD